MRQELFDAYGNPVRFRRPKWPWIIGILLMVDIVLYSGPSFVSGMRDGSSSKEPGNQYSSAKLQSESQYSQAAATPTPYQQLRITPTPFPEDFYLGVGDTSMADDLTLTFLNLRASEGNENIKPDEGYDFVLLDFELSSGSTSYYYNFELYVDGQYMGNTYNAEYRFLDDKYQGQGFIYPESGHLLTLVYQVPENWKELRLGFLTGLSFSYAPYNTKHDLDYRCTPADIESADAEPTENAEPAVTSNETSPISKEAVPS